jgi:hypothetical protein
VGPRAVLDTVVKRKIPSPRRESNPRTPIFQHVAQTLYRTSYHGSVYTLYTVSGYILVQLNKINIKCYFYILYKYATKFHVALNEDN